MEILNSTQCGALAITSEAARSVECVGASFGYIFTRVGLEYIPNDPNSTPKLRMKAAKKRFGVVKVIRFGWAEFSAAPFFQLKSVSFFDQTILEGKLTIAK